MALITYSALPVGPGTGTNSSNSDGTGTSEAESFVATQSGVISTVAMFIRAGSSVTSVRFAIYADSGAKPGARLGAEVVVASGSLASGAWNYFTGFAAPVVAGTTYWVAWLPLGGTLNYSDNAASGGNVKDVTPSGGQATLTDPAFATWTSAFTNIVNIGVMGDDGASSTRRPILELLVQGGLLRALAVQLLRPATPPAITVATANLAAQLDAAGAITSGLTAAPQLASTLAGTGALTPALTAPALMTATLAGTGSMAPALTARPLLSTTLAGTGTIAPALTAASQLSSTLAGVGTLSPSLTVPGAAQLSATLDGVGTINAALTATSLLSSTLAGTGTISSALTASPKLSSTLAGVGAISPAMTAPALLSGTLAATGTLASSMTASPQLSSTLAGVGTLSSNLTVPGGAALGCTLTATGTLTSGLTARALLAATLTATGSLTATMGAGALGPKVNIAITDGPAVNLTTSDTQAVLVMTYALSSLAVALEEHAVKPSAGPDGEAVSITTLED